MGLCIRVVSMACLALTAACASAERQDSFSGEWSYGRDCDGGGYITLDLEQSGTAVTGEWSEGTNSRGDQGLLKGHVKEGTLVVTYCSSTGATSTPCPQYDPTTVDHYTLRNGQLLRSKKYGSEYKNDFTLLPASKAKVERCMEDE